jgi:trehalose 6-phosphate synthase
MHEMTIEAPLGAMDVESTPQAGAHAADLVVLSNRLPVHRVIRGGLSKWETSPGGLVAALSPILAGRECHWIGWAGTAGTAPAPFQLDSVRHLPVVLGRGEVRAYYDGFCNRTIWPLYHHAIRTPEYRRLWWSRYVDVNARFARAAADVSARGSAVWVHDYHLQLVPAMLRQEGLAERIGFFLHIPFPPPELFAQLPWRKQVIEGLLGADVVGFQTSDDARNFREAAMAFGGAKAIPGGLALGDRSIVAREFPISIDMSRVEEIAASERVARRVAEVHRRLGEERRILLGVDRLDYTKGIDLRLRAFRELLATGRLKSSEAVFVQVAVPSRERVVEYRELKARVERLVGEINGEFGAVGRVAVHYLHRSVPPEELIALYRAADVMIVTPLRDGMNLVAKEFVAARADERGALVLSEFAGAARELSGAIRINPHDIDAVIAGMEQAVGMSEAEARRRMRRMRDVVRGHDVFHWAKSFLGALSAGSAATDARPPRLDRPTWPAASEKGVRRAGARHE